MTQSTFLRGCGLALIGAGVLTILINVSLTPFLPQHGGLADAAASAVFPWRQGASALAVLLLLFGCIGFYQAHADKVGWFGTAAFIVAFSGTAMALCIEWVETFLVSDLAFTAPDALRALDMRHGLHLYDVGALAALGTFAVGWIMLAVSALRSGLSRWGAWVVIIGFFLNPLLGVVTHGAVLALVVGASLPGIGWVMLGYDIRRVTAH
jgi:hypothetical protein